jgi:catechol 2,3-dioxygenase-like lactoylglutathione lyase family enzyme
MTIVLNHTIVPARDKVAAARFFARIFGLRFNRQSGHFAPVRVNKTLTLLFDEETKFDSHHYAFHVSKAEFDAILGRIKSAGIAYGSTPWSLDDGQLNDWNGGRGVYFEDPNGHLLEILTRCYGSAGTSTDYPHPLVAEKVERQDISDQPVARAVR